MINQNGCEIWRRGKNEEWEIGIRQMLREFLSRLKRLIPKQINNRSLRAIMRTFGQNFGKTIIKLSVRALNKLFRLPQSEIEWKRVVRGALFEMQFE